MEFIFLIGLFFIPFDNLFFAPTNGWAAIAPIIFFVYCIMNIKSLLNAVKKEKKLLIIIYALIVYSLILYYFYPPEFGNVIDAISTITLGVSSYLSFVIRYVIKKHNIKKDLKVLIYAYCIAIVYGVLKYIALKFNIALILNSFKFIEKRYYDRVAFTFTEPSFITIHVFGVLLIFYHYVCKSQKRIIAVLMILFSLITIFSKSSGRFLIDLAAFFIIYSISNIFNNKMNIKHKLSIILVIIFAIISGTTIMLNNERMQSIAKVGIYGDPSLAARYFRINASIKGYRKEPIKALFGTGLGNSYYFLHYGYDEAVAEYKSDYMDEVIDLGKTYPDHLFCMYIRLMSEFGILMFIFIFCAIIKSIIKYKGNLSLFLMVLWIYVQFDSYALYSIWLYLFLIKYNDFIFMQDKSVK